MKHNSNTEVFFALLRAGLWEKDVCLQSFDPIDFNALFALADEQSVVGLIAAGLEHVKDMKIAKQDALPFLKKVFSLENRNASMNDFIGFLMAELKRCGIFCLLVKGQGVAQCYSRPQWRSSGDIDLLLSEECYEKAKVHLQSRVSSMDEENTREKHLGMKYSGWTIELHGYLHNHISRRADKVIDLVQSDALDQSGCRVWHNGQTDVFLPSSDNDVIIIFSHILQHFFRGGIGLRQICDWCRLLWTYKDTINRELLESRIREMGLMTEWKAFAAYAVSNLGLTVEAMPLYDSAPRWHRKADRINSFVLRVGNFGRNRDDGFYEKYPYLVFKAVSLCRHIGDFFCNFVVFPMDSLKVFGRVIGDGVRAVVRGK